jgi:NTP pyrophosphatase (non-canonical NTP hydrolase)
MPLAAEARRAAAATISGGLAWVTGTPWDARCVSDLTELRDRMRNFTEERDWGQFHDPKSLLLALVGEVGELAELMQWLPAGELAERARDEPLATRLGEELADVLIYLVRLADVVGCDLSKAAQRKLQAAEQRFPSSDVSGVAPTKIGSASEATVFHGE